MRFFNINDDHPFVPSKGGVLMLIDDYLGKMVLLTLDTDETHEGLLENTTSLELVGYVKVSNGNGVFIIPEDDIVSVEPARLN